MEEEGDRDPRKWRKRETEIPGSGGRGRPGIYLTLHCRHQNDFCVTMGIDENRFNILLIERDKVTRQCPHSTLFDDRGQP